MPQVIAERYEILHPVGEGGMARVYAAHDRKHDRRVAVKMLRPELAAALGTERFLREIHIAARLTHQNILPLYDSGESEGSLYYVMPLVEGESLGARLAREGIIPPAEALRITRETAEALSYAHDQGFVHRDIKPDNIMLSRGHVLVADFGIARALASTGSVSLTATGMSMGTPLYMSPEQAFGDPTLNYQTDIYSLGCVVFEMLTGRPPFVGDTAPGVVAQHITEPVPTGLLPPNLPPAMGEALPQALAKRPADRFTSALEFSAALDTALKDVTPVTKTRAVAKAGSPPLPFYRRPISQMVGVDSPPVRGGIRWMRSLDRRQRFIWGGVVIALVLAALNWRTVRGAVYYWLTPTPPPPPTNAWLDSAGGWLRISAPPLAMLSLGDSAIAIQGESEILVFNGERWSREVLPYPIVTLGVSRGDVWAFSRQSPAPMQRLTSLGWVPGDTVPIAVSTAWADAGGFIVANMEGQFAQQTGSGWRQMPSGRKVAIPKLFGADREGITALGRFATQQQPDSLVRLAGSLWQSYDPRPDSGQLWVYNDGTVLSDGSLLVVGYERRGNHTAPMTLRRAGGQWRQLPVDTSIARMNSFDHVVAVGHQRAFIWKEMEPGLFEWKDGALSAVSVLAGRNVRAVTQLGQSAVVLTEFGTLFIERDGGFDIYGELPLDNTAFLRQAELFALRGLLGMTPRLSRIVTAGGRLWGLDSSGVVMSAECGPSACQARIEFTPDRGIQDLDAAGDTVIAVGRGGVALRWTSYRWSPPSWTPRVNQLDIRMVRMAPNGGVLLLTPDSALHVRADGEVRWLSYEGARMPPVAALGDSGVALVWPSQITVITPSGGGGPYQRNSHLLNFDATAARWACNAELILVSATPRDPLLGGGTLMVRGNRVRGYEVDPPIDLVDGWVSQGMISVLGRGGLVLTRPVADSAPPCERP